MSVERGTNTTIKPKPAAYAVMKRTQVLAAFVLVFLFFAVISVTCAQTEFFTSDKGDRAHLTADGKSVFACGATINIETEQGGGWLPDRTYLVNWTLRLDYVNRQFLNGSNFYIQFSWPSLEQLTPTIPAETVINQTKLSLARTTGTLSATFTPTNESDGFYMNPEFPFSIYSYDKALTDDWASGVWYGEGGTSTNILGNDATPQPSTPAGLTQVQWVSLSATALAMLVALSAFLVVKKNRKML